MPFDFEEVMAATANAATTEPPALSGHSFEEVMAVSRSGGYKQAGAIDAARELAAEQLASEIPNDPFLGGPRGKNIRAKELTQQHYERLLGGDPQARQEAEALGKQWEDIIGSAPLRNTFLGL